MKQLLRYIEVPSLILVPVILVLFVIFQIPQTAALSLVVVIAATALFFTNYEASRPGLRQIMPTVVLGSLAASGRILFAAIPNFKPVSAICILAGVVFGRRTGFMVGALGALVSNFFFGQGPWTPWQMYGWGLVGYLAGVFSEHDWFEHPLILYIFGFLSAMLYSFLLNLYYLVGFVHPLTWQSALVTYGASLPFDLMHGAATVFFLLIIYAPWRKKLERIEKKYALSDH
ncbi:MAG: ECF transporter S component [Coriobacteriia bacterium]|nr:ECF transporter S component [Coriobacteriia bacterium]